jgi:hypothetical protein
LNLNFSIVQYIFVEKASETTMAEEEYEPDYDDGDFGGDDDIDGDDEEVGEETAGGMENIDVRF